MCVPPIKEQIHAILNQEMDRKEFLKQIMFGLFFILGFGGVLRALASHRPVNGSYDPDSFGGSQDGK